MANDGSVAFVVGGQLRACPAALWDSLLGPAPPSDWTKSDGCTMSPDYINGMMIWPACLRHDYAYSVDGPAISRFVTDIRLRINTWRCLRWQGASCRLAAEVAGLYWIGVVIGGWYRFKRRVKEAVHG